MAKGQEWCDLLPSPHVLTLEKRGTYQEIIDLKTKPVGSLGALEKLALQLAILTNGSPEICRPTVVVFAGDHGAAAHGISPFPQAVTRQMVLNFLAGGAAINVFARQAEMDFWVVDAGVIGDFEPHPRLMIEKVGHGTADYLKQPAMSADALANAIGKGRRIVQNLHQSGVNTLAFGEMGIGNSSSAALIMHALTQIPLSECVGAGTGLDAEGVKKKQAVLEQALARHQPLQDPLEVLRTFGGYEIAMMAGAFAEAAHRGLIVIVDGFIASAAFLVVWKYYPAMVGNCVFSHCSAEKGHGSLLKFIQAEPLLRLGLRLGEGTGAALALPLIRAAVAMYTEMASFDQAGVSPRNG